LTKLKLLIVALLAGAFLWCAVLPARADEPKKLPGEVWTFEYMYERCYLWVATEGRFTKGSGSLVCIPLGGEEKVTRGFRSLVFKAWQLNSDTEGK
jgi:hypothetical protein